MPGRSDRSGQVVGIDHVQLAMPPGPAAEAVAEDFYARLGFTRVAKPPQLAGRGGCWFAGGSAQLHLGVEADFRPALKAHPALLVADLDALAEDFAAAGIAFRWDEELPGVTRGYVSDPFGNRIELIQARTVQAAISPR